VRFNDAYLAEGLMSDFMYHAAGKNSQSQYVFGKAYMYYGTDY
jgi:hypothetical protein